LERIDPEGGNFFAASIARDFLPGLLSRYLSIDSDGKEKGPKACSPRADGTADGTKPGCRNTAMAGSPLT